MLLGVRIKALRMEKNLTQEDLAKMIHVTKSTISYYENNRRFPTVANLHELAKVLNVSYDYLMGNDSYEIAEDSNVKGYGMYMATEEIEFIKAIREYDKFHDAVIRDPKRCAAYIQRRLY